MVGLNILAGGGKQTSGYFNQVCHHKEKKSKLILACYTNKNGRN